MAQSLPPDYTKLPFKDILVNLNDGILTIVLNRAK